MGKFWGNVGYGITTETSPGVWTEVITKRQYFGDVIKNTRKWEIGEKVNENLNINNRISILADPFAYNHFHTMRFVEWMGAFWKVTNIEVLTPRLILTIGGVYNGDTD